HPALPRQLKFIVDSNVEGKSSSSSDGLPNPHQLIGRVHQTRWLVKDLVHKAEPEFKQDLLRIDMFRMVAGSQYRKLQRLKAMLYDALSRFKGVAESPLSLHEVESQLMACRQ